MGVRLAVYWRTNDRDAIERIRERFGIPRYTTVNGESPAEIEECDMPLLMETERRGFIMIRNKKWCEKGGQYIFLSQKK